jgi:hypothetical protein
MKTKLARFMIGGSLLLIAPVLMAQDAGTNALPLTQTVKYRVALENDRSQGEHSLLPPGLKEKLQLTEEQRLELKPIEDDFAETSRQFQVANQPRIEAAQDVSRQARESKDEGRIEGARRQLQNVWSALQPYRANAVRQIRPLLTPDQIIILDDASNQWHENHGAEANDPSAN